MSLSKKILLLGSRARVTNLPVKEVSLLQEGSLPEYGYNPGDFIELLAGRVSVEAGRLEQCLTWLSSFLTGSGLGPRVNTVSYGREKEIFQLFKRKGGFPADGQSGWFMVHQILPPGGRRREPDEIDSSVLEGEEFRDNAGIIIVDDGGNPPDIAALLRKRNPDAWVLGLGITAANWKSFADEFGGHFVLLNRLSDLETTRMEMDSAVVWESLTAMTIRALKSREVGLWDSEKNRFKCHLLVEMFPDALLYLGPENAMFRHYEGTLPQKGASGGRSVPCYDTMVPAMLAVDCLSCGEVPFQRGYFFDFSKRVLNNWKLLVEEGYYFDGELEFPNLDFSSTYPEGQRCSFLETAVDPSFFELKPYSPEFDKILQRVACQEWNHERKQAFRNFFGNNISSPYHAPELDMEKRLGYMGVILSVLRQLKEEVNRKEGFSQLRMFQVGALRSTDPAEIAPVVTMKGVMGSYVSKESFKRPLCIGVFGPPGSGKSFAVEQVARVISKELDSDPFEFFEFNLTQFSGPGEINSAIDLVRATVAKGKVPVAFWDEFDCMYDGNEFGYLRYFLPSMQDGVTYVHGIPRYIGRSVFVFAGGVKYSWEAMEEMLHNPEPEARRLVKILKIPDFMSRMRVVMDIDGIDIPDNLLRDSASHEDLEELRRILLKRAFIISHQMTSHWKKAARKTSGLLLRLLIADYKYGARSIEAVIEASHAANRLVYGLPELITPPAARIHARWRIGLERRIDEVRREYGFRGVW